MKEILIISTGGTFNKVYDPLTGTLEIDKESKAVEQIASKWLCKLHLLNIIGKDSLDINTSDRQALVENIRKSTYQYIIVIHGTDTMDITASYLDKAKLDKSIILTGAMVPYSIDPTEATANLASAYGYTHLLKNSGIYIAMNGVIDNYLSIKKNRIEGKFDLQYV
ncbi:MAG: Asparaginase [uncultured Sulfurovum sp.]|uniref:Asparaginase n=1 Tax=uncultured Sulfurovum sp. TaxID=269237 RepID=A0A6S6U3Z6_9BACT|nr:MAG: Asparaginase [uncultured Sulfurovum sp.]